MPVTPWRSPPPHKYLRTTTLQPKGVKKMGNYRSRRPGFLQGWQINVAEMMFRGMTDDEIAKAQFNTGDDERLLKNAKARLRNLRKNEHFQEYYRSLITEWSVHNVGRALNKLSEQIDATQPWLANKAANDVITQSKLFIAGADDNTVVVKVEGMPELGTPDDND